MWGKNHPTQTNQTCHPSIAPAPVLLHEPYAPRINSKCKSKCKSTQIHPNHPNTQTPKHPNIQSPNHPPSSPSSPSPVATPYRDIPPHQSSPSSPSCPDGGQFASNGDINSDPPGTRLRPCAVEYFYPLGHWEIARQYFKAGSAHDPISHPRRRDPPTPFWMGW